MERRLNNLTVKTLRNYCDVNNISGAGNLKKMELVNFVAREAEPVSLEEFLSSCEADYLMESLRKAIKWGKNDLIVRLDPRSNKRELHAEFNGLDIGLRRVYYIDFFDVYDSGRVQTICECADSREKGLFCPHQMAVLIRASSTGVLDLGKWRGPITPEVRNVICSQLSRNR